MFLCVSQRFDWFEFLAQHYRCSMLSRNLKLRNFKRNQIKFRQPRVSKNNLNNAPQEQDQQGGFLFVWKKDFFVRFCRLTSRCQQQQATGQVREEKRGLRCSSRPWRSLPARLRAQLSASCKAESQGLAFRHLARASPQFRCRLGAYRRQFGVD